MNKTIYVPDGLDEWIRGCSEREDISYSKVISTNLMKVMGEGTPEPRDDYSVQLDRIEAKLDKILELGYFPDNDSELRKTVEQVPDLVSGDFSKEVVVDSESSEEWKERGEYLSHLSKKTEPDSTEKPDMSHIREEVMDKTGMTMLKIQPVLSEAQKAALAASHKALDPPKDGGKKDKIAEVKATGIPIVRKNAMFGGLNYSKERQLGKKAKK